MDLLENLLSLGSEYEWFEFKESWFSKDGVGEYISALSNEAALCGKEYGYLIWGIKDGTLDIVGTTTNLDRDIDHESYKHYLARNLKPSIPFESAAFECKGKRVVILEIPAAKSVETKYKGDNYVKSLLNAYAEEQGVKCILEQELSEKEEYKRYELDLNEERKSFYQAESVREATRDSNIFNGDRLSFERSKKEMREGLRESYKESVLPNHCH